MKTEGFQNLSMYMASESTAEHTFSKEIWFAFPYIFLYSCVRNTFRGLFQSYIIPAVFLPRTINTVKHKKPAEFVVPIISSLICGVSLFHTYLFSSDIFQE